MNKMSQKLWYLQVLYQLLFNVLLRLVHLSSEERNETNYTVSRCKEAYNDQPQCATLVSLVNEYGTGTGSGSDDVLRCVPLVDVYAQSSIHIFLQVVYIYFMELV
jgi:hypothetical protein